ncbi:MAG TPA: DUF5615 family PIN-like protein [Candidatus Corynebacterium faecigallinarum]|uniref:DUF5615 family PIN-like protein n=1 Tax=Candidatus Corynebacterium faecigallinarum TaxID=2838528 RepID=A0A9D2TMU8_9CORY|nr:DUF5615 family PIN-like protein [Candidatus Corynebacterium faecigallinarum]
MKFLLDENLSPRLASSIPGAQHLRDLLTTGIGGLDIIVFAATHGMTIISPCSPASGRHFRIV